MLLYDLAIGHSFATITNPRVVRTKDPMLLDIIIIAIYTIICEVDDWATSGLRHHQAGSASVLGL